MLILSVDAAKVVGQLAVANLPSTLPAANLTGVLPGAVFPATLPAASGANLTALAAAQLTGTLPNGVFPATLPAASGANLTNLAAANVAGVLAAANLPAATAAALGAVKGFTNLTVDAAGNVSLVAANVNAALAYTAANAAALNASALTTGTVPNAAFPATLPAVSGAALTSLSAANLTGTLPNAVFPATLPAASGANLTALTAANLTGTVAKANLPGTTAYTDAVTNAFTGAASFAGAVSVGSLTIVGGTETHTSTVVTFLERIVNYNVPGTLGANDPVPTLPAGFSVYRGEVAGVARPYAGMVWDEAAGFMKASYVKPDNSALDPAGLLSFQGLNIAATGQFNGSGAGLTSLPSSQLVGALPAISGAALTSLTFTQIGGVATAAQIPVATAAARGTVIVGSGLTVAADGTISVGGGTGSVTGIQFGPTAGVHSGPYAGAVVVAAADINNALTYTAANAAALNASALTSGTLPNAVFPATLPVSSGANLTSLTAINLVGLVPVVNLPVATATVDGIVKPGAGMAVDGTGSITNNARKVVDDITALGDLSTAGAAQNLGYGVVLGARKIAKISVLVGTTLAAGAAATQIDILMATGPGAAFSTLFTTVAKPSVVANGGVNYLILTGASLPDITSIPDGAILTARVVSAPAGTKDLAVTISE